MIAHGIGEPQQKRIAHSANSVILDDDQLLVREGSWNGEGIQVAAAGEEL